LTGIFLIYQYALEVPPCVEYSITSKGKEFISIIDLMEEFGKKFGEQSD